MAKKLDFCFMQGTEKEFVKARIFKTDSSDIQINLSGGPFVERVELSLSGLDALIEMLHEVRETADGDLDS